MYVIHRVGQPPPYKPQKKCSIWHVIDASPAYEKRDLERGDDDEVVTRSPHVFGPATWAECNLFAGGTDADRAQLRYSRNRRHGQHAATVHQTGERVPCVIPFSKSTYRRRHD